MTDIIVSSAGSLVGDAITSGVMGGEYLGWTGFPGWQQQAEYIDIQHIRWPAGINAEDRIENEKYVFDIATPTLVSNWPKSDGSTRAGLSEMFAYANEQGASFSLIVPTGRYVKLMNSDPATAIQWIEADINTFVARLAGGLFGQVPTDFTLEIGAEYYSTDAWAELQDNPDAEDIFADVFARIVVALRDAETVHGTDLFKIAVQASRFQSNDDVGTTQDGELADADAFISAYLASGAQDSIDALIWHRYIYTFDQTSHHLTPLLGEHTLVDHLSLWESRLERSLELVVGWAAPDMRQHRRLPEQPLL